VTTDRYQSGGNHPVIVMGMHRSGTTLVAELLDEVGVFMGLELGHYHESAFFQRLNQDLLANYGADWTRPGPFLEAMADPEQVQACVCQVRAAVAVESAVNEVGGPGQPWGWKDPRNTLTLPVWLGCYPRATVIHVVRNGVEAALSLHRRETRRLLGRRVDVTLFPPTIAKAYELGRTYEAAARAWAGCRPPPAQIRYESLLEDPAGELGRLCWLAGVEVTRDHVREITRRRVRPRNPPGGLTMLRLRLLAWLKYIDAHEVEQIHLGQAAARSVRE